ncbi:MAG: hypothetical protein JXR76_26450 [Deltaproteobacteria bacterium]|nr:hypothetical protein [Deltaproteobacteria bacterium]
MRYISFLNALLLTIALLSTLAGSVTAVAGGERVWELAGYDEFSRGELQQTVLSEKGEILAGLATEKIDLDATGLVWSVAKASDGTLYLGTAYDGKIYRIDGNKAHLIATTDSLVVTDMLIDENGDLLASTIPTPTVWRITAPKKVNPQSPVKAEAVITLPAEDMIWSIAKNETTGTLYMGTGPDGKIWAAGKDYKPQVYLDTEEKHILDILPTREGIYAGTSPGALLLKVTAPGVSYAIADFEGTEVKSIASMSQNRLAVGVNAFTYPRKAPSTSSTGNTAGNVAAALSNATGATASSTTTSATDKGFVYWVNTDGSHEKLLEKTGTHITTVAVSRDDSIWAAMGSDGKIFSITKDRIVFEAADLQEREVMCLLADATLDFAATGDTGAAYLFTSKGTEPVYLSPVLDAKNISSFGRASWVANGPLNVTARCGNTVTPDKNWTQWSAPVANGSVPALQNARYVQFRFQWPGNTNALLQFELFYKPANQRAVITRFDPDTPFTDTKGGSKGDAGTSERTIILRPSRSNARELSLSWSVDNPDNDQLRYRLFYKPIDMKLWIPIFKEDERYTKTRYTFNTDTVPEGRYHFKLTAEDSIENPLSDVLADEDISVPVDIDNHPPVISRLSMSPATHAIEGEASDSYSPISALDYAVDGGIWLPVAAADGMLDETTETFKFEIVPPLSKGGHVIAVRAIDRNGNYSVREIHTEMTE